MPRPCAPSATGWPPSWPPRAPSATPCAGACACCSARSRLPCARASPSAPSRARSSSPPAPAGRASRSASSALPRRRAAVVARQLGVPALEVGQVLLGDRARRVVLGVEVGVDVLGLAGEALVHRVEVGREASVGVVDVLAVVLDDPDRVLVGARDLR